MLAQYGNIDLTFAPYNGIARAIPDLMAGRVNLAVGAVPSLLPQVRTGALRALAVTSTERRSRSASCSDKTSSRARCEVRPAHIRRQVPAGSRGQVRENPDEIAQAESNIWVLWVELRKQPSRAAPGAEQLDDRLEVFGAFAAGIPAA